MDSKNNLEAITQDIIVQTVDLPEGGDGRRNLKISDIDNTSLEKNDTEVITNVNNMPDEQSLQTEINELGTNIISLDKRQAQIGKEPLISPIMSSLDPPLTKYGDCESNIIISPEQCLDGKLNNDNDMKLFLDDESCSDMQDEEIQLRWDDDDINLDCEDAESVLEQKKSICKDNDTSVEHMDLDKVHEIATSDTNANQDDKNVMLNFEKNVSQHDFQNSMCEKIFTPQNDKHIQLENEQCLSLNKCKEIVINDESLIASTKHESVQTPAQVDDGKNVIQHKCEDIGTQQEYKRIVIHQECKKSLSEYRSDQIGSQLGYEKDITQPEYKQTVIQPEYHEPVTHHVDDKMDQLIQRKTNIEHESEHITSEEEAKNSNQHKCEKIISHIDSEKNITFHEHKETAAIETKKYITEVDNVKNVNQNHHEDFVPLMDNEESVTQNQSEKNASVVDQEKYLTLSVHKEIAATVENEEGITQNEMKTKVAHVHYDKTATEHKHEETVTRIDNEESVTQHQSEENAAVVDKEKYTTHSDHEEFTAPVDNRKKNIIPDNGDIAPQVDSEKNIIQNEHKIIAAPVDSMKTEIKHDNKDMSPQIDNEKCITQSQHKEIIAPVDNEENKTQNETKTNVTHVDYDKTTTEHVHKETVTLIDNVESVIQHQCEENATVVDKEKYIAQSEHGKITALVDNRKKEIIPDNRDIAPQVDNERYVTQSVCQNEKIAAPVDNDKIATEYEHERTVTLIDNEKSVTQHQSEKNATVVGIEKNITQCEHKEIAAPVDKRKKEIKLGNEDIAPQVDNEKTAILSECDEIAIQHGLKKPDMMLEIPSQELIDFMDDDEPDLLDTLEMSSDEAAIEISNDNNCDVDMVVGNDAITAINLDVQMENVETSIECQRETPKDYKENQKTIKTTGKDQSEVCAETISLLGLKESMHKEKEQNVSVGDPQPSTSKACMIMEMRRDSDEVGEVSDSLGLLAESTRVLEDDEEQDDEDDADDDDDYDQYEESSNQMGAEFSEDSNAVNSEIDTGKVTQMGNVNVDKCKAKDQIEMVYIEQENEACGFQISDIKTEIDDHNDIGKHTQQMDHSEIFIAEDGEQEAVKILMSTDDNIGNIKDTDIINISPVDSRQENETVIESALPLPNDALESNLNKEDEVVLLESSSDEDLLGDADNFSHEIEIPLPSIDVPDLNLQQQAVEKNSVELDETSEKDDPEKSGKHILDLNQMLKSVRGLEVFSVDSDDDDMLSKNDEDKRFGDSELREVIKCVNISCRSSRDEQYYEADAAVLKYYEADRGKNAAVCESCAEEVFKKNKELIEGIKNNTPLLELDTGKQIVEISDSDSEDEEESVEGNSEKIGEAGAKLLEGQLAEMFNTTWQKYNLDSRLGEAQSVIKQDLCRLEKESQKITKMLHECQSATDKLRNELYATFEQERKTLPPIVIFDTDCNVFCEYEEFTQEKTSKTEKAAKRKAAFNDIPAKKLAIVTAQNTEHTKHVQEIKPEQLSPRKTVDDDNVDVSVVKLSVESAPADLPQPGEVVKPQLRTGMTVYAMRNNFGIWLKAKIIEIQNKNTSTSLFTMCRLKLEHKVMRNAFITLPARCIAFEDPPDVRLTIGTRIIATSDKNESFYSGVVAEVPNPVNNYRYLVFFDDGHAKYARHGNTRLVCECSPLVWEEVHPNSRDFVRQYLLSYPERPMVRLHPNQSVKAEWNGKWWHSRVIEVDASLALILLAGDRMEWIYRGSTRLGPLYLEFQAAERQRSRPMPRSGPQHRSNMPYVEYTRSDDPPPSKQQQNEEIRRQRAVAKKSTVSSSLPPAAPPSNAANLDNVTSRVVYYTPKNAIRPYKMVPHQCGPKCKRTDVLALKDLRTYNPLAKPLLSAWERQIVRFKGHKEVMYRAPCGRRLRNMAELHRYLRAVKSDMPVDLFDFGPSTHCLAEFVLNKCIVGKKDLSHGKENVPVPCVNYYDDSLPEFCSYNTERTPTAGVPLNLDPEFLCGCDCEDDCKDKKKCACWKMTLEGARTIGLDGEVGYVYRRLPDPLPSGIYECNSRCKCKNTCLNRVAQHPLQLKLQVFKTLNRGWGIRALNDVPKGAFLCVYAGNLLTDATANLDGLNEGDEYLAELDYIEVVEQMKEGYEEDIPGSLKESARQKKSSEEFTEDEESSSEEEDLKYSKDERDDDFRPGYVDVGPTEFNKLLRTREKREKEKSNNPNEEDGIEKQDEKEEEKREEKPEVKREEIQAEKEGEKDNVDDVFITISDDEEVREPSRFTAQAGMNSKHLVSKYRSVRSYFGKDEACYIMDAKVQGNIGRYLNHSCCPNVFVQNVFVDTHDPRFPWVAFFALSHIRAGTELTWNYNYDVGSVPGKILYCYCGAANCRGRLL